MMRIVTWNAQHGGGQRATRFAERLAEFDADVVVISEFRNNEPGNKITSTLQSAGLTHFSANEAHAKTNTVVVGAREEFGYTQLSTLRPEEHRCVVAEVAGINIYGLYFPQKDEKVAVFEALCDLGDDVLGADSILIGDFNTGQHYVDEAGKTFYGAEYLQRLEELGWVDAWRSRNPEVREFSWYSHAGNGFRIDHAYVSDSLNRRIQSIRYEHAVRESGLSDHSALIVDIEAR